MGNFDSLPRCRYLVDTCLLFLRSPVLGTAYDNPLCPHYVNHADSNTMPLGTGIMVIIGMIELIDGSMIS